MLQKLQDIFYRSLIFSSRKMVVSLPLTSTCLSTSTQCLKINLAAIGATLIALVKMQEKMRKEMRREYKNFWTCRDRTDKTWCSFKVQMDEMITAYMDWDYLERKGAQGAREAVMIMDLAVIDVFGKSSSVFIACATKLRCRLVYQRNQVT